MSVEHCPPIELKCSHIYNINFSNSHIKKKQGQISLIIYFIESTVSKALTFPCIINIQIINEILYTIYIKYLKSAVYFTLTAQLSLD